MKYEYSVGSLYAGIGGICLGFKNAGFRMAWANERDKYACITYRANFDHILYEEDVLDMDISKTSQTDILTAGFPCQPFSLAGYRKGFDDNRGNHFFRIMEFVDEKRPSVIVLENVKNLNTHDNGNTMRVIEASLRERRYSFHAKVLNTKDYGNIPHNRERVFMVAFNRDRITNPEKRFKFPAKEPLRRKIKDVVDEGAVAEQFYYRKDRYMYDMLEAAMVSEDTVYQFRRQYVRENKSNVCPTLTANMGTGGHNVPLIKTVHGFRKLTPRECLRFQGFPETYKIPAIANTQMYKQAGNSVSVPVIEALATQIKTVLDHIRDRASE